MNPAGPGTVITVTPAAWRRRVRRTMSAPAGVGAEVVAVAVVTVMPIPFVCC